MWQRLTVDERSAAEPGYHDMGWMAPRAYVEEARRALDIEVFERLASHGIRP